MSNSKLRCTQCEERLGEEYKPSFESLSRLYCYVDKEGNYLGEVETIFEENYCPYCNQTLELE